MKKTKTFSLLSAIGLLSLSSMHTTQASEDHLRFKMVPSGAASECLPHARAKVTVYPGEDAEIMTIRAKGLPPETAFDFFVTQLPNPPFGLSWYQGDIETNSRGYAKAIFIGRFNKETFIVAPGVGEAPLTHENGTFPDVGENPATDPVHTYHLGLWFNSPQDAVEAGCPGATTPFNGDHDAGIQVFEHTQFRGHGRSVSEASSPKSLPLSSATFVHLFIDHVEVDVSFNAEVFREPLYSISFGVA